MRIDSYECWTERVPLTRPYTIAYERVDAVELSFVRITSNGVQGVGSASPIPEVTGESFESCRAALDAATDGVRAGHGAAAVPATCPAAAAAIDMALWDVRARQAGLPLAKLWGQVHLQLPTSITIGIKDTCDEALDEAREYLGRGFRHLKIKIGLNLDADIERLVKLRALCGTSVELCIDANQGFQARDLARLERVVKDLSVSFLEQPLPPGADADLSAWPTGSLARLALDESVLNPADAQRLAADRRCGIFNIKLMKCGGPSAARRIAAIADTHRLALMWGCSDESRLSIAAALHTAFACPATRYLDLDGHLDLASDPARGGFLLEGGMLRLTEAPGLGVELERMA